MGKRKRKPRYSPDLVKLILNDDDYILLVFTAMSARKQDILFLPKERKNGDYTMKCPLHKDKTPSFRYSSKMKIFKCFGCGKAGHILQFYRDFYDVPYAKAIKLALQTKLTPREPPMSKEMKEKIKPEIPGLFNNPVSEGDNDLPF